MRTFVYSELKNTYGSEAESIIKSLDKKLTTMEENTSESFQILLQTIVYPFIFTVDILKSAGKLQTIFAESCNCILHIIAEFHCTQSLRVNIRNW